MTFISYNIINVHIGAYCLLLLKEISTERSTQPKISIEIRPGYSPSALNVPELSSYQHTNKKYTPPKSLSILLKSNRKMYIHKVFVTLVILAAVITSFNVAGQFSNAVLHPNCLKIEPTSRLSAEWGLRLFAGANFYIPFGSSQAIHHIAKLISSGNKTTENVDDLQKLCTRVTIKGFKLEVEGHEENFLIQDCSVIKKGQNDCKVNSRSENPEYQKDGDAIVTIVWTDNKTSMAIIRCTADGHYNDWYTFSTLTSLNATMKDAILTSVSKLGFSNNLDDTLSPSYEGCELFPPEEEDDS